MDGNNPTGYAQVLEELTAGGVLLASYVHGLAPIAQSRGGVLSYYLLDGHSGVRLLANAAERLAATIGIGLALAAG